MELHLRIFPAEPLALGSTWTFWQSNFTYFSSSIFVRTWVIIFSGISKPFTLSRVFWIKWTISSGTVKPMITIVVLAGLGQRSCGERSNWRIRVISIRFPFRNAPVTFMCCSLVLWEIAIHVDQYHEHRRRCACYTPHINRTDSVKPHPLVHTLLLFINLINNLFNNEVIWQADRIIVTSSHTRKPVP